MNLRRGFLWMLMFGFSLQIAGFAQSFPTYYERNLYLDGSAAAYRNGLLGYANPANLTMLEGFNFRYYWLSQQSQNAGSTTGWGVFTAVPGLGFGAIRNGADPYKTTTYRFSMADGNRSFSLGFAYEKVTGDKALLNQRNLYAFGLVMRPARSLSLGFTGNFATKGNGREGVAEIGIRPFLNNRLTLFGDAALQRGQSIGDANWSAGAAVELIEGLQISGRYFDSEAFTVGLNLSFGNAGVSAQTHYANSDTRIYNTNSISIGDFSGNLLQPFFRNKHYVSMEMKGRVDYLKYDLFDPGTQRFMEILQDIRDAQSDSRVSVIALNLSGMRVLPEHAWEIRQALLAAKTAGKKIVIFFDNAEMTNYHLASVADKVMMDPVGSLMLPGYLFGRTFLKGTLDKMGLGFDEWRFFKYKSAAEALSREEFSDADREQRQALADAFYETARAEICESRGLSTQQFDHLIDTHVYFMPEDALTQELVDTLCRWDDVGKVIQSLTGKNKLKLPMAMVKEADPNYGEWSEKPRIAVVYALGECAMDSGIRARWLDKVIRRIAKDPGIKALVLRVDSPGGDGMASDYVAEALRVCAEKKPVVISQGQVAASGGYWISMYGDTIVAAPTTITGSIGVIGGWIYDKGLSGKLGMTADHVQRGDHADMGFGVTLPLLGIRVPARNLNEQERERMEKVIKQMYAEFVEKVADGRGMTADAIDEIGQGRVWNGTAGKANGLVDEIGGLSLSIDIARKMAKIPDDRSYNLVEIPKSKGFINLDFLSPVSVKSELEQDVTIRFIKMMTERPGYPLPVLLPGDYPVLD